MGHRGYSLPANPVVVCDDRSVPLTSTTRLSWLALAVLVCVGAARGMFVVTNLGTMALGEVRNLNIEVKNRSAAGWSVTAAVCSCACVTVKKWPRSIPAGSTQVVRVSLHADMAGSFGYMINLIDERRGEAVSRIILNVTVGNETESETREGRGGS